MEARILIIEDNQTNRELMVYLLQAFGYVLLTACDGKEGFARLTEEVPDLIVCDLELPGMTGYEFGREVKGHREWQGIPLVAVTAYAMVGDRDKVLAAGFDGYIPKPINPESFVSQIEAFLDPEKLSHRVRERPATAAASAPRPPSRATVLVVDDSPVNLSLLCNTLEPSGYQVVAAKNPDEAAELARRNSLDLILCDLHMPGRSGLEFLRLIKADAQLRAIPFVLMSASGLGSAEGIAERAAELGAEAFVPRPIEPQSLLALVEACLKKIKGA